jgi:hypothetical protein
MKRLSVSCEDFYCAVLQNECPDTSLRANRMKFVAPGMLLDHLPMADCCTFPVT